MIYTAPRTWATGDIWQASEFDATVRDDMALMAEARWANVSRLTARSVASGTTDGFDPIEWESIAGTSGADYFTLAAPTRLTVPADADGYYRVAGQLSYSGAGVTGVRDCNLRKNGATMLARARMIQSNVGSQPTRCNALVIAHLVEGDYVELGAFQDSGIARLLEVTSIDLNWFSLHLLGV